MLDWGFGGGGGYGGGGMGGARRPMMFESEYHCQSTAMAGRDVDDGDKIFLPPSALDKLARMNVEYPMLFEAASVDSGKRTHCGVLEFSAEEGYCYMPHWMMQNLAVQEFGLVRIKNVSLGKATFIKLRAQSVDFLEVSNPRALFEVTLRKFTCLTVGDTIRIPHLGKNFYLDVMEVQPNGAASIIETDCNVDFDEPLGYKESKYAQYEKKAAEQQAAAAAAAAQQANAVRTLQKARAENDEDNTPTKSFQAFGGSARRIDGKLPPSAAQEKERLINDAKDSKDSKDSKGTPSTAEAKTSAPTPAPVAPAFESSIGDKYSKKKIGVAAFAGAARKLNG